MAGTGSIGGFPPLEVPPARDLEGTPASHLTGAMRFGSGRSAMIALLRANGVSEVLLPSWTCPVVPQTLSGAGIPWMEYGLGRDLQPDWEQLSRHACSDAAVVLNSYFGTVMPSRDRIERLRNETGARILLDHAQSLYEPCPSGCAAFYSPRKFVGVPDGGLLITGGESGFEAPPAPVEHVEPDLFSERLCCLGLRREFGSAEAYEMFRRLEEEVSPGPTAMSSLSSDIFMSLDHGSIASTRRANYSALASALGLPGLPGSQTVPLCLPLAVTGPAESARRRLVERGVFVPRYWPGIDADKDIGCNMLALPVDQRCTACDMSRISREVAEVLAETGLDVVVEWYGG
jgi:hypothetical protein